MSDTQNFWSWKNWQVVANWEFILLGMYGECIIGGSMYVLVASSVNDLYCWSSLLKMTNIIPPPQLVLAHGELNNTYIIYINIK